ncbi:MAG: ATP phosphoribosyltransferase [Acidobacteria bacterium]|nr:ATP phosphoribosyltransferase [Acidobacteriota bacterium]MCW5971083.1 ATP phosphoribosyltransferase [Blastocatellales bacterium]
MLTIAISKGRMQDATLALFARAGIEAKEEALRSRRLLIETADGRCSFIFVKPGDVPTYVEYGVADAGVCGRDVLLESRAEVHEPLDLKLGYCRLAVAGRREVLGEDYNLLATVRVATKFPRITSEYFHERGIPIEVITLSGSVEIAPLLGLSDRVVDLVETGRTLRENGLEVIDVIMESTARLIVNRASFHLKREEISRLIADVGAVVE